MSLRQSLIEERVAQVQSEMSLPPDEAFERFSHATYTGISLHAFDPADLVDGSQDKQIDLITIVEDDGEADIFILSTKFTEGFSSNALIQVRNGLNWIFNKPRADIASISNVPFKDKILEIRSLLGGLGYSNARIRCAFITNGITDNISNEYRTEEQTILQEYDNGTFQSFKFESIGADELIDLLNVQEKKVRSVDADIPIRYDANNPSLIRYHSEGLKGLICTALASDVAAIVNADSVGAVFDANIRRFLGASRAVNADIAATCSDPSTSYQFWFLNNGITIICDDFDPTTDPDNAHVKIKNLQIINGCQTATALAVSAQSGALRADTRVLLRIYKTDDPQLIDKIVLTTNNQNRISSRDLKANDRVQIDMEGAFHHFGYFYERKVNQYRGVPTPPGYRIVANEIVGQAYLGIVLRRPADARRRKYKVWADFYGQIFAGDRVESHVLSVLILDTAQDWIRNNNLGSTGNDLIRKLAKNGVFHLSRMAAFLSRGGDNWNKTEAQLKHEIDNLKSNPSMLHAHLFGAMNLLESIIQANAAFSSDVDGALKSNLLEVEITRKLHNPQ
jgi:hypothetical protein